MYICIFATDIESNFMDLSRAYMCNIKDNLGNQALSYIFSKNFAASIFCWEQVIDSDKKDIKIKANVGWSEQLVFIKLSNLVSEQFHQKHNSMGMYDRYFGEISHGKSCL